MLLAEGSQQKPTQLIFLLMIVVSRGQCSDKHFDWHKQPFCFPVCFFRDELVFHIALSLQWCSKHKKSHQQRDLYTFKNCVFLLKMNFEYNNTRCFFFSQCSIFQDSLYLK